MSPGKLCLEKSGGWFYSVVYSYQDENGETKQKWETWHTYKEALKRKAEVENQLNSGTFLPPTDQKVSDFLYDFVATYGEKKWGVSMYDSQSALIANYINPIIGEMEVQAITPRVVETPAVSKKHRKAKTKYVSNPTIEKIIKLLRCAFKQAVRWELIGKNPFDNTVLPKTEYKKRAPAFCRGVAIWALCCYSIENKLLMELGGNTMPNYIAALRKLIGNKPIIMVGASVIVEDAQGKVLLQQRTDNHCWGYAGGALELGETTEDAAKRELLEETGLIAEKMELFGVFSGEKLHHVYPNGDEVYIVDIVYLCKKYTGALKVQEGEVERLRFFSASELPENISPPVKPVLKEWIDRRIPAAV